MIHLTVPVVPVAQPRQRHALIGGHVRNYTPTDSPVNAYKAALAIEAAKAIKTPISGPIEMYVWFYLPRPKSLMTKKSVDGTIPHTTRFDLDNLCKSCMDAMKGIAWHDDAQVFYLGARKWYCEKYGQPRVVVELWANEGR